MENVLKANKSMIKKASDIFRSFKNNRPKDQLAISNLRKRLNAMVKNEAYADLLTYSLMLDDQVILHKDGALSMSFAYFGPDIESETEGSVDALSAQITHALSQLEEGFMVEMNLVSAKSPGYCVSKHYRDVVSEIIDIEREFYFQQEGIVFKTDTFITFTYTQTNEQIERLRNFSLEKSEVANEKGMDEILKKFKQITLGIVDLLEAYNIHCVTLEGSKLLSFLFNCINCSNDQLAKPKTLMFLDSYLTEQDLRPGIDVKIGDKHVALLSLDDMPSEYYPTILDELSELQVEFRWSTRFIPIPDEEAKKIFKKKYTELNSKEIGISGMLSQMMGNYDHRRDRHASEMKELVEQASSEHSSGKLFGYFNATIVIYQKDYRIVEEAVSLVIKKIKSKGFSKVRRETLNSTEAFLGSLPSHGGYNPRKVPVIIDFLADVLPTTGIYQGQPFAPNPSLGEHLPPLIETTTRGLRKFNFNTHFKDVGHQMIIGPTGTGKSILLSIQIAQWLKKYVNARVIGFDYREALLGTTLSLGGQYIDCVKGRHKLSPFFGIEDESYRKGFMFNWLLKIFKLTAGKDAIPEQQQSIIDALDRVVSMPKKDHKLIKFISQLNDRELQSTFKTFKDSVPHDMFSGEGDDSLFERDFLMFEKCGLLALPENIRIAALSYIYHKIYQTVSKEHKPTLMPNDEAWIDFMHPMLKNELLAFIKAGRHVDVAMIIATQVIDDIANSDISNQIRENLRTEIFLPNDKLMADQAITKSYRKIGLNDQELKLLQFATPKCDYYVRQTLGNKLMQLKVGKLALCFLGMTVKDDASMKKFHELYNPSDESWAFQWLRYCGYSLEADELEKRLSLKKGG